MQTQFKAIMLSTQLWWEALSCPRGAMMPRLELQAAVVLPFSPLADQQYKQVQLRLFPAAPSFDTLNPGPKARSWCCKQELCPRHLALL